MRTRLTTLALVGSVMLAGMAAFAQYSPPSGTPGKMHKPSAAAAHKAKAPSARTMHRGKVTTARQMKIMVDGRMMRPSTPPLMMKGRVMLPMRSVFEELGATVHWDATRHEVLATKGDRRMTLRVGDRNADLNGRMMAMEAAPMMHRNNVYVPLRAVSEALGASVAYNSSRREVAITTTGRQVAAAPVMPAHPAAPPARMALPPAHEAQGLPANARLVQGGTIMVNGKRLSTKDEPVMVGEIVLVPAQAVLEDLKAKPTWNASERRLTATHNGQRIVITAGNRSAMIGSRTERLSEAPFVYRSQVYVPLDFIGRAVSGTATWEASRKEVVINTQARRAT